ncbi:MAG: hypothetical protein ACR2OE_05545 [Thermomicrobiales bacterium]
MNYHPRITSATTANLGPQSTPELKRMLQAEQQISRSAPRNSYHERIADANVADLEGMIVQAEANDAARERGARERAATVDAKRSERQAVDDAALKATLRVRFMGQAGATAADFERLYPRLRDKHLMRQSDAGMMQARSRMRI